jgi:hypothetical protein
MSKWYIYDGSGLFTGKSIDCPGDHLDANVPDGCGCTMDAVDPLSQRVDMATGLVVGYQPPAPSDDHQWDESTKRWLYVTPLALLKSLAIAKTFADVDAVVKDAVGNRTKEYELAEAASRVFAAAGYVGEVSKLVTSYALSNATLQEQTNEWAAQNIIARAMAFEWATEEMRDQRMTHGVAMQTATTSEALAGAVSSWSAFITGLRAQLGLSN